MEKINHEIGLQNKQLKELYEDYKGKIDFFKWIFIRYFIVEYERSLLNSGNTMIYTSDAIANLVTYAKKALKNYQNVWRSKACNQYCDWTEQFMKDLIEWAENAQLDEWNFSYIDDEYERAFSRFFEYFNNIPTSDRLNKEHNQETTELGYWRPQDPFYGTIDEG